VKPTHGEGFLPFRGEMAIRFPGGTKMAALPYARASRAPSIFGSTSTPQARGPTGFFFFARRQGINQLDDTKKRPTQFLGQINTGNREISLKQERDS